MSGMDNVTLLVSSFDDYAVCWEPFCYALKKYWPDHPEKLYFITNHETPPCGEAVRVGPDKGWAANLRDALDRIDTPYVLYAQEDYWLKQPVNTQAISAYVDVMDRGEADYIRLHPVPGPDGAYPHDERLGVIAEASRYRTSLQMALWRKAVLEDLVVPGESPWHFEVAGSARSRRYGARFLSVKKRKDGIEYVFTAIVDGEWSKAARRYARDEAISVRFDRLPRKPWPVRLRKRTRRFVYRIYKKLSRRLHAP